jgi:surface antigen
MKTKFPVLIVVVFALCLSGARPAIAQVWPFRDSVFTKFTGDDMKLFQQNVTDTLNAPGSNSERTWSNPATGTHGKISAGEPFTKDAMQCRKIAYTNEAGDKKGSAKYTYCRAPDGKWKALAGEKKK